MVSTSRGDLGHLLPLVQELKSDPRTEVKVLSLRPRGDVDLESRAVMSSEIMVGARNIVLPLSQSDWPNYLSKVQLSLVKTLEKIRPEVAVILGDRFELLTLAGVLVPMGIPFVHLHGGEVTLGAKDNDVRHAITKLAALHCVSNQTHADIVLSMGEDPNRIVVTGALAVDNCAAVPSLATQDLGSVVESEFMENTALVTLHPITNGSAKEGHEEVLNFFEELRNTPIRLVITPPNQDPGRELIMEEISRLRNYRHSDVKVLPSLGVQAYYSLVRRLGLVVGNSSSGVIDAPILGAQSVDFGTRQAGRARPANVIHVPAHSGSLPVAIQSAFERSLSGLKPNYDFFGEPGVAKRIVQVMIEKANLLASPKEHRLPG